LRLRKPSCLTPRGPELELVWNGRRSHGQGRNSGRQRERELRPFAFFASTADRATVSFDDRSHDRQPESGALDVLGRAAAEKALEQLCLLALGYPAAVVGDAHDDGAVAGADLDFHRSPLRRKLD